LKLDLIRRADLELKSGRVDEKIGKIMTRCNLAKLDCNPLIFFLFFFIKTISF
jgi:hypothetical protein